jgi:hypothetical protein
MVSLQSPKHPENKYRFPYNVILKINPEFNIFIRKCYICKSHCNILFNWSSSRKLNQAILISLLNILTKIPELDCYDKILEGFPICLKCCNKFHLNI